MRHDEEVFYRLLEQLLHESRKQTHILEWIGKELNIPTATHLKFTFGKPESQGD